MTTLTITPDSAKKRMKLSGTVASGEKVAVTISGFGTVEARHLQLRAMAGYMPVGLFPLKEDDEWTVSGDDLTCTLNLATEQAERLCKYGANVYIVLEDTETPQLYGVGELTLLPWVKLAGVDVPVNLDNYKVAVSCLEKQIGCLRKEMAKKYEKPVLGIPKTDLAKSVQTSLEKADAALPASSVSAWALAAEKPSYTAAEVGAVPTTRKVNGKDLASDVTLLLSDVPGDAGHRTVTDAEKAAWSAKQAALAPDGSDLPGGPYVQVGGGETKVWRDHATGALTVGEPNGRLAVGTIYGVLTVGQTDAGGEDVGYGVKAASSPDGSYVQVDGKKLVTGAEVETEKRYRIVEHAGTNVQLVDFAVNVVKAATSDALTLTFPEPTGDRARDFVVKIDVTAETPPEVTFLKAASDAGLSIEAEDEDWAALEVGANYFGFTETAR
ncbi:MAG: hypothetical protein ACI4RA_03525 [Kiritimatiellia bacterium]